MERFSIEKVQASDRAHTILLLPDSLKQLLISKSRTIFSDHGFDMVELPWSAPAVTDQQLSECVAHLESLEKSLSPAKPEQIVARVVALLSHFYVPDVQVGLARAIAHDWAGALREFPWWAVEASCSRWLSLERRRPTPADIRELCHREAGALIRVRDRLRAIVSRNSGAAERPTLPISTFRRWP